MNADTASIQRSAGGQTMHYDRIISEINGGLDMATKWAQKSYENYNHHLALGYVNILKSRSVNDAFLSDQQIQ